MAFGTDDGQTACVLHFLCQLDVRTTTCHVGSDCHYSLLTGVCHDFSFLLVEFCIQYVVRNVAHGQHSAEQFGNVDRCCTDKYRTACLHHLFHFFDNGVVFFLLCLVDAVVHVDTLYLTVGRDVYNVEFIDVPEFACFRFCRTGHT